MAAIGQIVTIGTSATLVFEVIDQATYVANGYNRVSNPNIFTAHEPSDPLPIYIAIPTGSTVYFGSSLVTSSDGTEGCPIVGPNVLVYNVTGSDSLYGVVASSTAALGLLTMRQSVAGDA